MRIGLSLKLVLFLLVVFTCMTVGGIYYTQKIVANSYVQNRIADIRALVRALDETILSISEDMQNPENVRHIDLLASQTDARIIISGMEGKIHYDSKRVRTNLYLDRKEEFRIGKAVNTSDRIQLRMPEELETAYHPVEALQRFSGKLDDVTLVFFEPIHSRSGVIGQIMIEERISPLEQYMTEARDRLMLFMAEMFLAVAAIAFVMVQLMVVKPIMQVEHMAKMVAANEFESRLNIRGNDEISTLSTGFNTMIYNLEKATKDLEEKNEGLIHFSKELELKNEELNRRQKLIDFDLRLAHNVQQELLPQVYPRIDGVTISAANFQVGEIGGDCFDFYKIGDKKLGAFIGDVSGKGIAAALVMSMVTILFSQLQESMDFPARILGKVNDIMYRHFGSRHSIYLTCFFLNLDMETNTLTYSCAGHNPPFLYRAATDELINLESEGFGLGMFSKVVYEEKITKVLPGDKIVLFTDGVVDSRDTEGHMFGLERLKETVKESHDNNSFRLTHLVVEELEIFAGNAPRQDDLTIIIMEIQDEGPAQSGNNGET